MPNYYLRVKQGCISRWQYDSKGKTNEYGLYSDGFFNCVVIALQGINNGRLVMIHADSQVILSDLKREIEWCGNDCKKILYCKDFPDAKETVDDIFDKDPLRNEFSLNLIKCLKKNGVIAWDKDVPPLPDGSLLPEFQATTIYADNYHVDKTYYLSRDKEYIDDDSRIQEIYIKLQKPGWGSYSNKKGSNSTASFFDIYGLRKALEKTGESSMSDRLQSSNTLLFTPEKKPSTENKRSWAPLAVRQNLYPVLDLLTQELEEHEIRAQMPDQKFIDKTSKTGWQLFEFAEKGEYLSILNLGDKEVVDKLVSTIEKHTSLSIKPFKSGICYCLGITFQKNSNLKVETENLREVCKKELPKMKIQIFV